jgi:hypothetical protein
MYRFLNFEINKDNKEKQKIKSIIFNSEEKKINNIKINNGKFKNLIEIFFIK